MRATSLLFGLGLSLFTFVYPSPSDAQTLTLGTGLSEECYRKVASPLSTPKAAEDICGQSLQQEVLSARDRAAVLVNRGISRMRQGNMLTALEDFEKAKRLSPDLPGIYINEGAALVKLKRFEEAKLTLEKALELETKHLQFVYLNLGLAREGLGDYSGAYFDIAKAYELAPNWSVAKQELSRFRILSDG